MVKFLNYVCLIITCVSIICCPFTNTNNVFASSRISDNINKKEIQRSLESLRDLNSQTWQIIVYPSSQVTNKLILRIVGYPGSLRVDHPTNLEVVSGRKKWDLEDITKRKMSDVEFLNNSAVEFDLSPLIYELDKNRPLRLSLPGLINDLPIPPYLVSEWRTLAD